MLDNVDEFAIVLTTVPSEELGKAIAQTLLKAKLAACINLFPIQSYYTWQGEINCDSELQLIIKTRHDLLPQITETIQSLHSYEIPEILVLPIVEGSQPYLQWLKNSLRNNK